MKRKIIWSIDKQKSIARKAFMETIKECFGSLFFWLVEIFGVIVGIMVGVFIFAILPLMLAAQMGCDERGLLILYLVEGFSVLIIVGAYHYIKELYYKNYQRIANEVTEEQKEDSSELNLHNSKNCMYCGKQLVNLLDINNPEDYGLHTPYLDFSDKVVCTKCDFVVTQTDRLLKAIIDGKDRERDIKLLEEHISYFPVIFEKNN